jgi:hypothetical protein
VAHGETTAEAKKFRKTVKRVMKENLNSQKTARLGWL